MNIIKQNNTFKVLGSVLLVFVFLLTGCTTSGNTSNNNGTSTDTHTYYTVTFDSMGGSEVESQRIMEGNPVVRPTSPTRTDYDFVGWYKDNNLTDDWDFSTDRVNSDLTLYASWLEQTIIVEATPSLEYERVDDTYIVTGVGEETNIVIPSTYEGLPVVAIRGAYGTGAFARKDITSVIIPDSIIEIGQNTFNNCSSLVTVSISENSNLTTIGNNAFSGNSSLTSIFIPKGVETIGNSVFNNCGALNSITVDSENTHYYSNGSNLIETETQTLIRGSNNSIIPEGVTNIASAAFRRSTISEIVIPSTVTTIGNYAFDDCLNLTSIEVSENNTSYASYNGILYNKEMTDLIKAPEGITGEITLSNSLETIPTYAFDGLTGLTYINIPSGNLTSIAFGSFRNITATIRFSGTEEEWNNINISSSWGGNNLTIIYSYNQEDTNNVLVVYFSATSRTEGVANYIGNATSGFVYEITPVIPYTSEDLNYNNNSSRANQEQSNANARPEIEGAIDNFDYYNTVFIGYPIWHGIAPRIIQTFLESNDFLDKTVYVFSTSASSSGTAAYNNLVNSYSNINFSGNRHYTSSTLTSVESSINEWITELGLN